MFGVRVKITPAGVVFTLTPNIHKGMWEDPRMKSVENFPIDGKRMIMGGFEPIIAYRKGARD